jgi:glycogen debranching enzyme
VETIEQLVSINTISALESRELNALWQKGLRTLQSLQTPLGITASGQDDHFHAIFGRDSLWTVLLALETGRSFQHTRQYDRSGHLDSYLTWLHELASSVLLGLARLQGRVVNDANEEQPGWIRSHRIEQEWFLADYFQACNTQAWTAAAVLYFTSMLLDG